ncbi:hypothetical protein BDZ94DRAFT_1358674 [Collybia nuda]|uniref:Uncharacterized protein n=1 Tax=Collybia nuda TaxID=64659 RepID=A0A9P5Y5H1_9AGAR|nr:hypothetical protein BDZ94DRAFT_1358674 [Collybia nuda]
MATRGPTTQQPAIPLCDYCNQKPKFSNHQYCSKTCASQAATLCNQCHKKPKFQNFEYCGKACAAVAKPQTRNPAAATAQVAPQAVAAKAPKAKSAHTQKAAVAPPTFDPIQLAKLVAQQIPQVQAMIASANSAPAGPAGPTVQTAPVAPAPQVAPVAAKSKNPFLNLINSVQQQTAPANGTSAVLSNAAPAAQQLHISTQPTAQPAECLIPDCDQPVHVDAKGLKASDYCSMRHREEAVATGLASPCIMCLTLPQSEVDYFCGRACREESLNKFE